MRPGLTPGWVAGSRLLLSAGAGRRWSLGHESIMRNKKIPPHETKVPASKATDMDGPEALSFPDKVETSPESSPPARPHARVYQVGNMRFPVREAPLRDSPRGKLVHKFKEILKKGKGRGGPAIEVDEHEPPRRPASGRPSQPDRPIGFPRFRPEAPEPFDDDDEE